MLKFNINLVILCINLYKTNIKLQLFSLISMETSCNFMNTMLQCSNNRNEIQSILLH